MMLERTTTGWLCAAMIMGLLAVGWWPFDFRRANNVRWVADGGGVHFQPASTLYESRPDVDGMGAGPAPPFTIELWLQSDRWSRSNCDHILTIHDGRFPSNLVICQWHSEFLLRIPSATARRGFLEAGVDALQTGRAVLVVVTGDSSGTSFYVDGVLVKRASKFVPPARTWTGTLVVGDSVVGANYWTGSVFGLAMLNRRLSGADIAAHVQAWTSHHADRLAEEPGLTGLFLFDEKSGPWVDDRSTRQRRLFAPAHYSVWDKPVLETPWHDGVLVWPSRGDVIVNVLGFAPFGFLLFLFRGMHGARRWAVRAASAITAGAGVSLLIELVQIWLPNRHSSVTDLALNTLGTAIGVVLATLVTSRPVVGNRRIS